MNDLGDVMIHDVYFLLLNFVRVFSLANCVRTQYVTSCNTAREFGNNNYSYIVFFFPQNLTLIILYELLP
jgi:hypothetical protein